MRKVLYLPTGLLLSALFGAVPPVQAADHEFCRGYADSAVHQFHDADKFRRCRHHIHDNPARWSPDYEGHYNWCRGVDRRAADGERNARAHALDDCIDR